MSSITIGKSSNRSPTFFSLHPKLVSEISFWKLQMRLRQIFFKTFRRKTQLLPAEVETGLVGVQAFKQLNSIPVPQLTKAGTLFKVAAMTLPQAGFTEPPVFVLDGFDLNFCSRTKQ